VAEQAQHMRFPGTGGQRPVITLQGIRVALPAEPPVNDAQTKQMLPTPLFHDDININLGFRLPAHVSQQRMDKQHYSPISIPSSTAVHRL
jgi:hypothetical protein